LIKSTFIKEKKGEKRPEGLGLREERENTKRKEKKSLRSESDCVCMRER